jgi:hypothetical protein
VGDTSCGLTYFEGEYLLREKPEEVNHRNDAQVMSRHMKRHDGIRLILNLLLNQLEGIDLFIFQRG